MNSKIKALFAVGSFAAFVLMVSFVNSNSHEEVQAAVTSVSAPAFTNIQQNSLSLSSTITVTSPSALSASAPSGVFFTVTPSGQASLVASASVSGPSYTPGASTATWTATATVSGLTAGTNHTAIATVPGFAPSAQSNANTASVGGGGGLPGLPVPPIWGGTNTSQNVAVEGVSVTNHGATIRLHVGTNWGGGWDNNWNWNNNWNWGGTWNHGNIIERGIVYSRTTSSPWVGGSNTSRRRIDGGGTGSVTTTISGRPNNVTYHVRGWVRTSNGYFHSPHVLSFTTGGGFWGGANWGQGPNWTWGTTRDSFFISTNTPTNVTNTSATVSGTIHNRSTNSPVTERGFVWSSTNSTPTISHNSATAGGTGFGTFSHTLTGLTPNTRYYVSAFHRTPGRIFYGNVVNFTTDATGVAQPGQEVVVSVSFRSLHGPVVGSQSVTTTVNETLSAGDLQPPAGFQVWPPSWSYRVTGTSNINVFVAQSGIVPPGVGGTPGFGQAGLPGQGFFPVAGNFQFHPDVPVSRGELAQAIFNLNQGGIVAGPAMVFSDVDGTPFVQAINFVSSRGYMIGYPDGTFRPNAQLSRAEMAAFMNNMYNLAGIGQTSFVDMPAQHWASNFVALAADRGMVAGFPDNTFRPEDSLTRAQAAALLVRAENRSLAPISNQFFSDVPQSHWAFSYIMSSAVPRP